MPQEKLNSSNVACHGVTVSHCYSGTSDRSPHQSLLAGGQIGTETPPTSDWEGSKMSWPWLAWPGLAWPGAGQHRQCSPDQTGSNITRSQSVTANVAPITAKLDVFSLKRNDEERALRDY